MVPLKASYTTQENLIKGWLHRGTGSGSASVEANPQRCNHVSLLSVFTPFHFSGYQENRKVSSPPESPWNNLLWADSAFAISKIEQHH